MSLQWTLVATFLYIEIFIITIFLLPLIPPKYWRSFFNSRFVKLLTAQSNFYLCAFIAILCLFFVESVREFRKYSFKLDENDRMYIGSAGYYEDQMRLFRAQRNFYISGFSIFGLFIIKRLANFISTQAKLSAEVEASLRQARNAAEQASQSLTTESDNEELNKRIKEYEKKIKSLENNLLAMKKQSESTNKAFDELTKKVAESERLKESHKDK